MRGLLPKLQPTVRGQSKCFGFTFGDLSGCPSFYTVYGYSFFFFLSWEDVLSLQSKDLLSQIFIIHQVLLEALRGVFSCPEVWVVKKENGGMYTSHTLVAVHMEKRCKNGFKK